MTGFSGPQPRQRALEGRLRFSVVGVLAFFWAMIAIAAEAGQTSRIAPTLAGSVKDALGRPLAGAAIKLESQDRKIIFSATSDIHGFFRLKQARPGIYALSVSKRGYKPAVKIIRIPPADAASVEIALESEQPLTLAVKAGRIRAQNGLSQTGTNKYTLTARDVNNLPTGEATPLNQVMLQMPGVALDQNQEIHIRGEHMGIQYQMNGVLLPLDINTDPTFTQLLNSYFVKSVSL